MLLSKLGHSPSAVEKLNISGNVTVTVMQDSGLLKGEKNYMDIWKGSHHRIPFHFKYGWFTPSYTSNAIERFTPSYTSNDTKLWKASQR